MGERSKQVAMMDSIYAAADQVLVYLGYRVWVIQELANARFASAVVDQVFNIVTKVPFLELSFWFPPCLLLSAGEDCGPRSLGASVSGSEMLGSEMSRTQYLN